MLVVNHDEKEKQFLASKPTLECAGETEATDTKLAINKSFTLTMEKEESAQNEKMKKEQASKDVECNGEPVVVEDVSRVEGQKTFKSKKVKSDRARRDASVDTKISADKANVLIMDKEEKILPEKEVTKEVASKSLESNKGPVTVESTSKEESVVKTDITAPAQNEKAAKRSSYDTNFVAEKDERIILETGKRSSKTSKPREEKVVRKTSYETNLVANQQKVHPMEEESQAETGPNDKSDTASRNIEVNRAAMTVERTDDHDSTNDTRIEENRRKENAQITSTICSKKCAYSQEENTLESLSKKEEKGQVKKAQAKVEVECSNEPLQVESERKILDQEEILGQTSKEESFKVKRVTIVEPQAAIKREDISVIESAGEVPTNNQDVSRSGASQTLVSDETLTVEDTNEENTIIKHGGTAPTETIRIMPKTVAAQNCQIASNEVPTFKEEDLHKEFAKTSVEKQRPSVRVNEECSLISSVRNDPKIAVRIPDLEFELEADEGVAVTNLDFQEKVKSAALVLGENFRQGLSVTEVVRSLSLEQNNIIRRPETQVALMNVAKRIGNAHSIHNIVIQDIADNIETTESFGTKALFAAMQSTAAGTEDIAANFQPKDFDSTKCKAVVCQILNEAHEIETNQQQENTEDRRTEAARYLNAIQCLVEETKEGKTVSEIITQRTPREMEEMQCIESQMAIVGALERLGHADITENIITEQMATDRIGLLNVIGTKALSSVLNEKAYTTEQIMALFQPQDFEKTKVKGKVVQILNIAQEINQAQVEGEN